ncbi:MAG: NifB/NifX family molybdenum-iron cluster-binding protein [Treponema sp.]|jgi:predicted Fe-Mo cluster-binding NifX family protein|nr:NifB/NifX family molybdenum-iron cluster-binding protein [Treponema sp.]
MIIAIPADERNENTTVCMSYGRCPFYMLYDTDKKNSIFLENSAAQDPGGAGIKASQLLVDKNVAVVLTPRCGENAAKVLNQAAVKIYKTVQNSAKDCIKAFEAGKLSLLTTIHPGFHGQH